MNKWIGILALFTLLILMAIFRDKFYRSTAESKQDEERKLIQKYLLNDSPLFGYNRPKLWIHSKFEINSRQWKSFHSRNTTELNQPYLFLTIQSIVNHCGNDFHICLIDDDSFKTLLPSWNYDNLSTLADPIKTELRNLAFLKLMYYYGGVMVPDSFLCFRSLLPWYQSTQLKPSVGQKLNRTLTQTNDVVIPCSYFIAGHKNNQIINEWILDIENEFLIHSQKTVSSEAQLITHPNRIKTLIDNDDIDMFEGKYIGIQDTNGKPILIEHLLTENYLDICSKTYGIYIPADEILSRTQWQWFAYMSQDEILNSNMIIAKYIMSAAVEKSPTGVNPLID